MRNLLIFAAFTASVFGAQPAPIARPFKCPSGYVLSQIGNELDCMLGYKNEQISVPGTPAGHVCNRCVKISGPAASAVD